MPGTIPQGEAAHGILFEVCDDILGSRRKTRHVVSGATTWTACTQEWPRLYRYAVADLVRLADLPVLPRACPDCVERILAVHGCRDLAAPAVERVA